MMSWWKSLAKLEWLVEVDTCLRHRELNCAVFARHLKHNLIGNEFGLRKIQFKFNLTGTLKMGNCQIEFGLQHFSSLKGWVLLVDRVVTLKGNLQLRQHLNMNVGSIKS